jgi:hypothetical protein
VVPRPILIDISLSARQHAAGEEAGQYRAQRDDKTFHCD